MAYTAFTSAEVASGKANKTDLWTKTKDNFADHETRITTVESATSAFLPIEFGVYGNYSSGGASQTNVLIERISFNMTVTGARLLIKTAGTAGTTEIDVLYKRGGGAFTSIFSTKPSVAFGAGNLGLSTNAVISTSSLLAGDILRLDITGVQTNGNTFVFFLEYEKA